MPEPYVKIAKRGGDRISGSGITNDPVHPKPYSQDELPKAFTVLNWFRAVAETEGQINPGDEDVVVRLAATLDEDRRKLAIATSSLESILEHQHGGCQKLSAYAHIYEIASEAHSKITSPITPDEQ